MRPPPVTTAPISTSAATGTTAWAAWTYSRTKERGGRFTQIYHLGSGINSARDDHGFIFDNGRNLGYVTSNRVGGTGNEDLYRVSRAAENMTIVVRDGSTNAPLPAALVDFTACGDRVYQTDAGGRYVFSAVKGIELHRSGRQRRLLIALASRS